MIDGNQQVENSNRPETAPSHYDLLQNCCSENVIMSDFLRASTDWLQKVSVWSELSIINFNKFSYRQKTKQNKKQWSFSKGKLL